LSGAHGSRELGKSDDGAVPGASGRASESVTCSRVRGRRCVRQHPWSGDGCGALWSSWEMTVFGLVPRVREAGRVVVTAVARLQG
jgi:hypothetical protein